MKFFSEIPLNPTPRMLRQFAAGWLVCLMALAFRFGLLHHTTTGFWLVGISLVGIIGLIVPRALYWPFVILTTAAFPIGWVMTLLALALMFYCVLTPLALIFRWRGRDALQLRKHERSTLWTARPEQTPPEKYLKQF
jgi:saxitoxin biosynthesis operon SxtJ-like protein